MRAPVGQLQAGSGIVENPMDTIDNLLQWIKNLPGTETPYGLAAYKTVVVIVGVLIIGLFLKWFLQRVGQRLLRYPFFKENENVWKAVQKAVRYGLVIVAGTYVARLFSLELLEKIFQGVLVVMLAAPAKEVLVTALNYLEKNVAERTDNKVDDIIFDLLNRFAGAILYVTAIIVALDIVGINVMPFIAGAGVAGIAIGFAAKDTLSNLIAGVLLIIDRPFEVGDRIEVWSAPAGSASWGDVIDIGLRATKIKTTDNIVIIIPNNEIMKRDIVNYTIISSLIRVRINIGVAYEADIRRAKDIIIAIARKMDWISESPAPKVVVRNFSDSSVDLQLRVWIRNARRRMDTISFVIDHVKEAFDQAGIEIPYPKRDIHVRYTGSPPQLPES